MFAVVLRKPAALRAAAGAVATLFAGLALSGCQSVATSSVSSLVRTINATTSGGGMDTLVGSQLITTNLGAPGFSSYAAVGAGTTIVTARITGTATGGQKVALTTVAGQQYSMLLTGDGSDFQASILPDQSVAPPSGQIMVRVIESAPVAGNLDVYLLTNGTALADATPILSNIAPGTVSGYLSLPVTEYTLLITGAGSLIPKLNGSSMTPTSGEARTFLIVDQKNSKAADVNVVVGDDLD